MSRAKTKSRQQTLGERLREVRADHGLTQSKVAELTGMAKSRISRYENDVILPSLVSIRALAEAFEIDDAQLIEGTRLIAAEGR